MKMENAINVIIVIPFFQMVSNNVFKIVKLSYKVNYLLKFLLLKR